MDDMTEFRVTYDGPALESHEMDPRELAPALLAMADLLEASARVLYGDRAKVRVSVKGSFKTGSFNIDFVTGFQWLQSARDLFAGPNASAASNALQILSAVGIVGKGMLSLLRWLRNRPITSVEVIAPDEKGRARVRVFVGDDQYEIEKNAIDLLRDVGVRKATEKVLAPLDKPGIDVFAVGQGEAFNLVVTKEERPSFAAPAPDENLLIDDVRKMAFSIVSLAFKEDNKWRLSDGSSTISATISDHQFLADVDENVESFAKGDSLLCEVRVRQWQTTSGTRTEYDVVSVLEHMHAPRQVRIDGLDQLYWVPTPDRQVRLEETKKKGVPKLPKPE